MAGIDDIRYLAEEGHREVFQVLAPTHGGIHILTHEDDHNRYQQAEHEGHEPDVAAHGGHGQVAARRRGDDAGVVGGEGLGKFVFLALLQQEEVERLLHLLLAAYTLQVLGLVGVAGNLRGSLRLAGLEVAELGVERSDEVVDALHDAAAHGGEALVVVGHQGVLLAGVGHQVVALQLGLVVFRYLLLYGRALDAGVGGQQLVLAHLAGEEVAYVFGHGQTRVEVENLLVGFRTALHILLCGSLYVGQQVAALERRNVFVDIAQLMLDDAQSLGDEARGGDGHLVFVVHPVLAIHGDDGVEHIFGTLGELVFIGEVDDRGLLLADGCRERCLDAVGHGIEIGTAHVQGLAFAYEFDVGGSCLYLDSA